MSVTRRRRALYAEPVEGVIVPEFRTLELAGPECGATEGAPTRQVINFGIGAGAARKEKAAIDARHRRAQTRAAGQIPGELRRLLRHEPAKAKVERHRRAERPRLANITRRP